MISQATVKGAITQGKCNISGSFTAAEAGGLASKIQAGALPFQLETTNLRTINPSLGASRAERYGDCRRDCFGL